MGKGLLIVWHSRTGATKAMAAAAADGASREGVCELIEAESASFEQLMASAGYIFCCPENLGSMTGEMKAFFDRCYYPVLGRIEGRPYGTLIAAGSDGTATQRQIDRIATGWRLRRVVDPLIVCTQVQSAEDTLASKVVVSDILEKCSAMGQAMAAGLALGVF